MIKQVGGDIHEIASSLLGKKPKRHIIVAKSAPPKKIIDQVRTELSKLDKKYRIIHIAYGSYVIVLENMSTLEIIDHSIYDSSHHSHLVSRENDDQLSFRIFPYLPLK